MPALRRPPWKSVWAAWLPMFQMAEMGIDDPHYVAEQVTMWVKSSKKTKRDVLDVIVNGLPQEQVDAIVEEALAAPPTAEELARQFDLKPKRRRKS